MLLFITYLADHNEILHVMTVLLTQSVQNFIVISYAYFKPEHSKSNSIETPLVGRAEAANQYSLFLAHVQITWRYIHMQQVQFIDAWHQNCIYVICSQQCTLWGWQIFAVYKVNNSSTSITNQPTKRHQNGKASRNLFLNINNPFMHRLYQSKNMNPETS